MQHRYATGEVMQIGDRVRDGNSAVGVIVGIIDSGKYGNGLLKEHWDHYKTGVLVDFEDGGLTLYPKRKQMAYFQKEGPQA